MDDTTTPPTDPQGPSFAGPPPLQPVSAPQQSAGAPFFNSIRGGGIVRTNDRWIGGVGGGLARRMGLDPLLVRGLLAASVLLGGLGFLVYGVAWALLPEERDGRIHLEETIRGNFDVAIVGAVGFVLLGLGGAGDGWWGHRGLGWITGLFWLGVVGLVIALVVSGTNRRWGPTSPAVYPGYQPRGPQMAPTATFPASHATAVHPATTTYPAASSAVPPMPPVPPTPGASMPPTGYFGPPAGYGGPPTPPLPPRPPMPMPPRPVRTVVHGPGVAVVRNVVGLSLIGLAGLLLAQREGTFTGSVPLTAAGIGVVLCGLGIAFSALRGRRSGVLGFFAIVAILFTFPFGLHRNDGWWTDTNSFQIASDTAFVPTTSLEAERGVSTGVGDVKVDLTGFVLPTAPVGTSVDPVTVPVNLGAGDLKITVPANAAVRIDVVLRAGAIRAPKDATVASSGVGLRRTYETASAKDGAAPSLIVDVHVGAGDITIAEEN